MVECVVTQGPMQLKAGTFIRCFAQMAPTDGEGSGGQSLVEPEAGAEEEEEELEPSLLVSTLVCRSNTHWETQSGICTH